MKKIVLISVFTLFNCSVFSQSKKALFLGNSYTYVNDLPGLLKNIALSFGDTLNTQQNTPGGYYFAAHVTQPTTLSLIQAEQWDFVILQEQSQIPSLPQSITGSDYSVPHSITLDSLIKHNSPCTETVFYMTWGRENGDASFCGQHPPVCTYDGMQQELRNTYLLMADTNKSTVSPVGAAWKNVRDNYPAINLYSTDGSHPNIHGSYLAACVFYATLFQKSPIGSSYIPAGITSNNAAILQSVASSTVLDSIELWRIGANLPVADFNFQGNDTITFSNNSINGASYEWNFGDGTSSSLESPIHNYTINGTYSVQLIAYSNNSCTSDTVEKLIASFPFGINSPSNNSSIHVFPNPTNDFLSFNFSQNNLNVTIYDVLGVKVHHSRLSTSSTINLTHLKKGVYFVEVIDQNHQLNSFKVVKN